MADWDYPRLALYAFAGVVALALLVAGTTSGAAFGAFNPGWDGASSVQSLADDAGAETTIVRNASRYDGLEPEGTVAFVLSPSESYDGDDAAAVRQFVEDGGTLVVAADYGSAGNELLADVGANASVDGRVVRDEQHHDSGPVMPVAGNVSDHTYGRGVDRLTLNYGSVVRTPENASNVTTVAATSSFAYVDANGNEELDDDETLASYPVVTVEPVGEGQVVVVSDPSVFINAMLDRPDNERFARNVVAAHERAVFDVSHTGGVPPVMGAVLFVRETWPAQVLLGLAGLALVLHWPRVRDGLAAAWTGGSAHAGDPVAVDPAAVAERLRERHPDADEERLERVTQGIMTADEKTTGND